MKKIVSAAVIGSTSLFIAVVASAHVSANTPFATAGATQEIVLQIGHGCEDVGGAMSDTLSLKVDIPAGVTSVRAVSNADFPTIKVDKTGDNVSAITWSKPTAFDADTNFYKLTFRAKVPASPFTKIYFKAHQTCKVGTAEWIALPGDGSGAEPAAEVVLLPAKAPGWNKYTVPVAIADVAASGFFKDAQIVWKGSAAYSPNVVVTGQIGAEAGVTALTALAANDEIFVKW